jgi:hypothetical protein
MGSATRSREVATFGDHQGTGAWASPARTLTSTAGRGGLRAWDRHRLPAAEMANL